MKSEFASIDGYLSHHARVMSGKVAVVQGDRSVTYGEVERGVGAMAALLVAEGMQKDDRVAILCDNSPEFLTAYLGCQRGGGISVALNTQYTGHEIERVLEHSQAAFFLVQPKYLPKLKNTCGSVWSGKTILLDNGETAEEAVFPAGDADNFIPSGVVGRLRDIMENDPAARIWLPPEAEDLAAIIYTSGTTGDPKGVMLRHRNFVANAAAIVQYLELLEADRVMCILPFFYSYGMSLLTTHVMVGGSIVLENSFVYPNKVLEAMARNRVTGFAGVPSTFAILLNKSNLGEFGFTDLRYLTQAGGAMSPTHALALQKAVPTAKIYVMYGQTEATARLTFLDPESLTHKPGSIGKAISGVAVELIKENERPAAVGEEGEIVATGPNIMAGYWRNERETGRVLRDGRLFTGDRAMRDAEGYIYIIGRKGDMIKSGAHRISPKEIEEVILELNVIHDVAVIGVPDEILGEVPLAAAVLKDGCSCTIHIIRKHCREKLAPFKIPREVLFVPSLPKTATGKVQRYRLTEIYGNGMPRPGAVK